MYRLLLLSGIVFAMLINSASSVFAGSCTSADLSGSHIFRGLPAEVVANDPIIVYSAPSTNAEIITQLDRYTRVSIASEAECEEEGIWWQIRFQEAHQTRVNRGYVLELNHNAPQIASLIQHLNVPGGDAVITASNLQQLQPVVSAEYEWPLDLVWSPDSEYLAVSTPWAVWVHNIVEPESDPIRLMPTARDVFDEFGAVMFSPDNRTIGIVDGTGSLHLVSLTGQVEQTIQVDSPDYAGIAAVSPELDKWATANRDGDIALWDRQTGQQLHVLEGHGRVGQLAFTPDGSVLVTNGGASYSGLGPLDTTVRLWDVETGETLAIFEVNGGQSMSYRPPSDIFISANGETAGVFDFREADNGNLAWVVHLIDIPSRSIRVTIPAGEEDGPHRFSFSSEGNILAVEFSTSIVFRDYESGVQLLMIPFDHNVQASAFSPDGKLFAVGYETGSYIGAGAVEIRAVP